MFRSTSLRLSTATVLIAGLITLPAHAVNKDMVQLQTQIQDLQNSISKLQQSNDERMGVLKDLVQQTADSVNKMSVAVDGMKLQMQNLQDASAAKSDTLSGQVQSLNDTLDESKARMARLEKAMNDIQGQLQSISAALASLPTSGAPANNTTTPPPSASSSPFGAPPPDAAPVVTRTAPATSGPSTKIGPSAPVADMYRAAFSDYMSARYPLAVSEFQDLIAAWPDDTLAGNAWFYIGEVDLRTAKPTAAVTAYNHLLERYPDNVKIPAAHLHKADAMISMKQTDNAVKELKALIQRFPNSPEAAQARTKLAALAPSARR